MYVSTIFWSLSCLNPLSSYISIISFISLSRSSSLEQSRLARQIWPFMVAIGVIGCWHDCGLIVTCVSDGLRYTLVVRLPSVSFSIRTSRNAIAPSFSSSRGAKLSKTAGPFQLTPSILLKTSQIEAIH